MQINDLLKKAHTLLGETRSGEILLGFVLNESRAYLYTHPEKTLTPAEIKSFEALINRRAQGEPIAYLLGEKEFYSLNFKITPDTLIPRPETEMLVDRALALLPNSPQKILELGVGSGALIVTLAKLRPEWQFLATDISPQALQVAQDNAKHYGLENIKFMLSDWYQDIPSQQFNLIISNPPYIAQNDPHLADLHYEPISALVAGEQGLECLEEIIAKAPDFLLPGGWLLVEHGYDQAQAVQKLFHQAQFIKVKTEVDLAGLSRTTEGQITC